MRLNDAQKEFFMERLWWITQTCYKGAELPHKNFFEQCVREGDVFICGPTGANISAAEVIGYALVHRSYYDKSALLRSVAVLHAFRGKGYGGHLLTELENFYRGIKRSIILHCKVDNPAQKLYFDKGYRVTARLKNYYEPEGDGLEMEMVYGN